MRRNEGAVPKIAPPVIATANAMNGHNGSITMVKKEKNNFSKIITTEPKNYIKNELTKQGSSSRRKCLQPVRRMTDATLLTTSLPQSSSLNPINLAQPLNTKTQQMSSNLITSAAQNAAIASLLATIAVTNNNNLNNTINPTNFNSNALTMWLIKNYGGEAKVDS